MVLINAVFVNGWFQRICCSCDQDVLVKLAGHNRSNTDTSRSREQKGKQLVNALAGNQNLLAKISRIQDAVEQEFDVS